MLSTHGLALRGGLDFAADEKAPAGPSGRQARSVLLVGNAGDRFWPHFRAWLADQSSGLPDPLDAWSRQVLEAVALSSGARVVMPNERPFQPFQQWAKRAEGLNASPLGILIHPEFGLWHAYRGAALRPAAGGGGGGAEFGGSDSPLRDMCRKTLPECLSGRRIRRRFRLSELPLPYRFPGRCLLHGWRLPGAKCLSA